MLSAVLLAIVQIKLEFPALLLERYISGGGWIEVSLLSVYAAAVTLKMMDPTKSAKWRSRIWTLFSIVFFLQLALGLMGFEKFLMTGKLHLPVPALIAAGPVYRGGGLFMLILFMITLVLVGPAWCSHLCYLGAWDDRAARLAKTITPLPFWRQHLRLVLLAIVLVAAYLLRLLGAPVGVAIFLAVGFGVIGVIIMLTWSRKTGMMTHCTAFCPIGWLATRIGKLSPFRVRIQDGCTECGACARVCRFDALSMSDFQKRRPGESCTLCGDCIGTCKNMAIGYWLPGLGPATARAVFIVMVVSLHAVFLGVART